MNQVPLLKYIKPSNLHGPTITWNNHNELMLNNQIKKKLRMDYVRIYLPIKNLQLGNWNKSK